MDITINKDTSIEEFIKYLNFYKYHFQSITYYHLLYKLQIKSISDLYQMHFKQIMDTPGLGHQNFQTLINIFIKNDFHNFKQSLLLQSILNNYKFMRNIIIYRETLLSNGTDLTENEISNSSFANAVRLSKEIIDRIDNAYKQNEKNSTTKEPNTTKQFEQPNDKSFRLIQQLLEIWNDDVEQQVEDIINQNR